ncbi:MAG: choloylglycine hydrolase [Ruminococcus sp.]|jgi:choloylglycine hydrolase
MCTCMTYQGPDFYFGRNLDLDCGFGEKVVITPRNYRFCFHDGKTTDHHYAMIGMAAVMDDYPLYAEAVNEKGLCMAGLYFPGNAVYRSEQEGAVNLAVYEFIPYILTACSSVKEVESLLGKINLTGHPFRDDVPPAPLHWMISDDTGSLTVEPEARGLKIYKNEAGVLTNNPPFPWHVTNLNNYLHLSADAPQNQFAKDLQLQAFSQGMGAAGLPGDASSSSRFVKTVFLKYNSSRTENEPDAVTQFFHILDNVSMVKGSVRTPENKEDRTVYSCCVNADRGIYYFKTYENAQISAVSLCHENLEQKDLVFYELFRQQKICYVN